MHPDLDAILRAWELSRRCQLEPGASADEIRRAQANLDRQFPEELVELYEACNGADVLEGNIGLLPLAGADLSVINCAVRLREWRWPCPDELVVIGDNGCGDSFGLWLPKTGRTERAVVVEIGAIFEEGSLAIVGTSLPSFLRGRSAYYLQLLGCPVESLDALGMPVSLRSRTPVELGDADYEACLRWASPDLPELPLSPYDARLSAEDVWRFAQRPA